MKPLEGVTVLDFTQAFSGAYCTMNLGDLGARVIKVERPVVGDQTRQWMPLNNENKSGYFAQYNRNKEGIVVDLSKNEGKEIIFKLVKNADIVVNNFKTGTLDRLGLGYDDLKRVKPDLIFASVTGYGQDGPLSKQAAYDNIIEATCGLMNQSGYTGREPVRSGASIGDSYTGTMALFGIMVAYYHKLMTGEGQTIDVAMQDSLFAGIEDAILEYGASGKAPSRTGNSRPLSVSPYDVFKCKNGWFSIAAISESGWIEFCKESGMVHLLDDPRYCDNVHRCKNNDELTQDIEPFFLNRSLEELTDTFSCRYFAAAPVVDVEYKSNDTQTLERKMIVEVDDSNVGKFNEVGIPVKFSETLTDIYKASPLLGQDTEKILLEIGYSTDDIRKLAQDEVVEVCTS